jgi:hypothetical protein
LKAAMQVSIDLTFFMRRTKTTIFYILLQWHSTLISFFHKKVYGIFSNLLLHTFFSSKFRSIFTFRRFTNKSIQISFGFNEITVDLYIEMLSKDISCAQYSSFIAILLFNSEITNVSNQSHQRWNRSGFLMTGTGTGPNRSDRTEPDRPVYR